jgi:hypothetical protein
MLPVANLLVGPCAFETHRIRVVKTVLRNIFLSLDLFRAPCSRLVRLYSAMGCKNSYKCGLLLDCPEPTFPIGPSSIRLPSSLARPRSCETFWSRGSRVVAPAPCDPNRGRVPAPTCGHPSRGAPVLRSVSGRHRPSAGRYRQRPDPLEHRPEQAPGQLTLRQQEPVIRDFQFSRPGSAPLYTETVRVWKRYFVAHPEAPEAVRGTASWSNWPETACLLAEISDLGCR